MQGEVELGLAGRKAQPSLILTKAVGIEDGNYETVTTRMQPSIIVWDLETVPDLGGFAAANDLVGKSEVMCLGNLSPIASRTSTRSSASEHL